MTRAAAVPRLLPDGLTLVTANARTSMAGVVGVAVSAPIAAGAAMIGPEWALRYAFVVFVVGHRPGDPPAVARRLEPGRGADRLPAAAPAPTRRIGAGPRGGTVRIPASMAFALRANCGPRWLSGFLTLFMAFLLRSTRSVATHRSS